MDVEWEGVTAGSGTDITVDVETEGTGETDTLHDLTETLDATHGDRTFTLETRDVTETSAFDESDFEQPRNN